MQIREGDYYVTRDGRTVGPAERDVIYWNVPINGRFLGYNDDGTICIADRDWDIVGEAPGSAGASDATGLTTAKIIVHYYDGREDEYPYDEGWLGPQPNFLRGFVEVDDGVFLNSKDISWIEVRKPR